MQDRVGDDLQLAELADELDVAQHLALGRLPTLLVLGGELILPLEGLVGLGAVLELEAALVEQQTRESAVGAALARLEVVESSASLQTLLSCTLLLRVLEVRSLLGQPLAQLCVHRTVFRFIESFFEDLQINTTSYCL